MPEPLPDLTVTIEVADAPTVRLTYNGGWGRESIVPYTSVAVRNQPTMPAPRWLYRLLSRASALLLLYAADEQHWPPALRPTRGRTDEP
jgi:hypothetical protein